MPGNFFSHGNHCLQHQHFVDQVISAGGFNVHCTQSAEAQHKVIMHQASIRVRHLGINETQSSMLDYLCLRSLFRAIKQKFPKEDRPRRRNFAEGVAVCMCAMKMPEHPDFCSPNFQASFLHREARVARVELLDLLCEKFELTPNLDSYAKLQYFDYKIGQKFTRADGFVMWATDSEYNTGSHTHRKRRDVLFLQGSETTDGGTCNALCCEAICFLTVSSLINVEFDLPQSYSNIDSITFILGRWFEPHSDADGRDENHRPVCPSPLHINHCLWKYARARNERCMLGTRYESTQRGLFDMRTIDNEKHAYFCLVSPENVLCRANMCPQFLTNSSEFDTSTWMQTVVLI